MSTSEDKKMEDVRENVLHKVPIMEGESVRSDLKTHHSQVASNDASENFTGEGGLRAVCRVGGIGDRPARGALLRLFRI